MNTNMLSSFLTGLGIAGTLSLLLLTGRTIWQYHNSHIGSFRWRLYAFRLKQVSAIACLFFLAMAACYGVLQEVWGWLYLMIAIKCGTWWLHYAFIPHI